MKGRFRVNKFKIVTVDLKPTAIWQGKLPHRNQKRRKKNLRNVVHNRRVDVSIENCILWIHSFCMHYMSVNFPTNPQKRMYSKTSLERTSNTN